MVTIAAELAFVIQVLSNHFRAILFMCAPMAGCLLSEYPAASPGPTDGARSYIHLHDRLGGTRTNCVAECCHRCRQRPICRQQGLQPRQRGHGFMLSREGWLEDLDIYVCPFLPFSSTKPMSMMATAWLSQGQEWQGHSVADRSRRHKYSICKHVLIKVERKKRTQGRIRIRSSILRIRS